MFGIGGENLSENEEIVEKSDKEKPKENNRKFRMIIALLVIVIILLLLNCCMYNTRHEDHYVIDCNAEPIEIPEPYVDEYGSEMTEIIGYENVVLSAQEPYVYIVNAKNNTVYLKYDIYLNDRLLSSTDLIPPNKMVEVELFSKLDAGDYQLRYQIESYDLEDSEECLANVTQLVKISVDKGENNNE